MQSWQHDFSCINYLNSDWNECYHCKCNILKNMNIFEHTSRLSIIGFVVICLSSMFQLIGLITPFWIYTSALPVRLYSGLWYRCVSIGNTTTCINFHCGEL